MRFKIRFRLSLSALALICVSCSVSTTGVFASTARQSSTGKMPVVTLENFPVGQSWIWDYFDPSGVIYSTERYTVLQAQGSSLLIEMASDYSGGQDLKPHHRMVVDLSKCLAAYSNPVQKKPWRFQLFYLSQNRWVETDPANTLAFEEKFNCNGHRYEKESLPFLTVEGVFESQPVFMQKLWRRIEGTWFGLSGTYRAIAVGKSFSGNPGEVYKMKLRAQ